MKTLCFTNPHKTIKRILHQNNNNYRTALHDNEDYDLQFSTFKSEDYKFYDDLPHFYQNFTSYELEIGEESESSEEEVAYLMLNKCVNFKRLNFRNSREKIINCLTPKNPKYKKLSFRNKSKAIEEYVTKMSKFIK
jgi:hypothetical protein